MRQKTIVGLIMAAGAALMIAVGGWVMALIVLVLICFGVQEEFHALAQAGHRPVAWPTWVGMIVSIPLTLLIGTKMILPVIMAICLMTMICVIFRSEPKLDDAVLSMLPMALVLFVLGYVFYVRKIPAETGLPNSDNKIRDLNNLGRSIWTILVTIVIILVFKIQVHIAVAMIIALNFVVDNFSWQEVRPMFASAFESKLILSTVVVMMFKDVLTYTGVIDRLPAVFAVLPVPTVVVFSLVFLVGTIIAGATAIIALGIPLAFAAMPGGGVALLVLLMCMIYIAMQVSPAHICLAIVTERFETSFLDLVKRTIPVMVLFLVIISGYSFALFLLQ